MVADSATVIHRSGKAVNNGKHLVGVFKEAKAAYKTARKQNAAKYNDQLSRSEPAASEVDQQQRKPTSKHPKSRGAGSKTTTRPYCRACEEAAKAKLAEPFHKTAEGDTGTKRQSNSRKVFTSAQQKLRAVSAFQQSGIRRRSRRAANDQISYYAVNKDDRGDGGSFTSTSTAEDSAEKPSLRESSTLKEVKTLMSRAQTVITRETKCAGSSVAATTKHLKQNPEAMAAVTAALGEASRLAASMGPKALTTFKVAFPAAFALMASPQFLIAAGVGVELVVVAIGGYKVVKRVRARKAIARQMEKERIDAHGDENVMILFEPQIPSDHGHCDHTPKQRRKGL